MIRRESSEFRVEGLGFPDGIRTAQGTSGLFSRGLGFRVVSGLYTLHPKPEGVQGFCLGLRMLGTGSLNPINPKP